MSIDQVKVIATDMTDAQRCSTTIKSGGDSHEIIASVSILEAAFAVGANLSVAAQKFLLHYEYCSRHSGGGRA